MAHTSELRIPLPVSVALGEVPQWFDNRRLPCLPAGVAYAKLAFAGCGRTRGWLSDWLHVRQQFEQAVGRAGPSLSCESPLVIDGQSSPYGWVAVAYADWQAANAPPPEEVVEAAAETRCVALLIDTFRKNGRTLLDCLPLSRLRRLCRRIRSTKMMSAFAGSLHHRLLPTLVELQPDVIGIRTAACEKGRRSAAISAHRVRAFKEAMTAAFGVLSEKC